jgi:hypothetical protein
MSLDWTKKLLLIAGLVALLVAFWAARKIRRALRRRRPARLNPRLATYGGPTEVSQVRRAEASKIIATSSTDRIVGYEIIRQVEAVFVEGFRRPEEALEGIKAAAAMKGANALTNVHTEHTAAGRCTARGDAVVVKVPEPNQAKAEGEAQHDE